jgi:cytochrome c553
MPSIVGWKQESTQAALPENIMVRLKPMSGAWCSRCHSPTGWKAERVADGMWDSGTVQPNKKFDDVWAEEAEKRLKAYRSGKPEGISMEEVFKDK